MILKHVLMAGLTFLTSAYTSVSSDDWDDQPYDGDEECTYESRELGAVVRSIEPLSMDDARAASYNPTHYFFDLVKAAEARGGVPMVWARVKFEILESHFVKTLGYDDSLAAIPMACLEAQGIAVGFQSPYVVEDITTGTCAPHSETFRSFNPASCLKLVNELATPTTPP